MPSNTPQDNPLVITDQLVKKKLGEALTLLRATDNTNDLTSKLSALQDFNSYSKLFHAVATSNTDDLTETDICQLLTRLWSHATPFSKQLTTERWRPTEIQAALFIYDEHNTLLEHLLNHKLTKRLQTIMTLIDSISDADLSSQITSVLTQPLPKTDAQNTPDSLFRLATEHANTTLLTWLWQRATPEQQIQLFFDEKARFSPFLTAVSEHQAAMLHQLFCYATQLENRYDAYDIDQLPSNFGYFFSRAINSVKQFTQDEFISDDHLPDFNENSHSLKSLRIRVLSAAMRHLTHHEAPDTVSTCFIALAATLLPQCTQREAQLIHSTANALHIPLLPAAASVSINIPSTPSP